MEDGFIVDKTALNQLLWVSGIAKDALFMPSYVSDRKRMSISAAYRCPKCGKLEFYAIE